MLMESGVVDEAKKRVPLPIATKHLLPVEGAHKGALELVAVKSQGRIHDGASE